MARDPGENGGRSSAKPNKNSIAPPGSKRLAGARPSNLLALEMGECQKRMMQRDHEGRSSARPNECPIILEVRRNSPLQKPHREKPAHFPTVADGFKSIIIFLTVCTRQRKPLLANDETARLIIEAWYAANFWRVGRYVIMPDHIHLFCAPNMFPPQPLKKWIGYWRNHVHGHRPVAFRFQFGNVTFGTDSCVDPNPTQTNGSTL
jgi:REP element-mobilizing transposase RayT